MHNKSVCKSSAIPKLKLVWLTRIRPQKRTKPIFYETINLRKPGRRLRRSTDKHDELPAGQDFLNAPSTGNKIRGEGRESLPTNCCHRRPEHSRWYVIDLKWSSRVASNVTTSNDLTQSTLCVSVVRHTHTHTEKESFILSWYYQQVLNLDVVLSVRWGKSEPQIITTLS